MDPVISTIHHNNISVLSYGYATGVLEAAFIFTKGAKGVHKLAIRIEHLYPVIVIITDQDVVLVVTGYSLRAVE